MHNRNYAAAINFDGVGYYSYLPHTFIYKSVARQPDEDYWRFQFAVGDKIFDKYSYATAFLQLPFFLCSHAVAQFIYQAPNGQEPIYSWGVMISAVFYLVLGMFFLIKTLSRTFSTLVVILSLFAIYAGTNLYFYTVADPSYSHVYSFFLFCLFIYLVPGFIEKPTWRRTMLISMVFGFIFLMRVTNSVIALYLLLYEVYNKDQLLARLLWIKQNFIKLCLFPLACVVWYIPQLIYWHYVKGHWIFNAYIGEHFDYWNKPHILSVVFGLRNGMLIYSPILIFSFAGLVIAAYKRKISGYAICLVLLLSIYLVSSWWSYSFGLAFGHRAFVEYIALLSIPMAYFISIILRQSAWLKFLSLGIMAFCIFCTIKLTYSYEPWAWDKTNWTWELLVHKIF